MSYTIEYRYNSWTESCGCCSDSSSEYSVWDSNSQLIIEEYPCELVESEEELREKFSAEYGDFNISADTHYF